MTEGPVLRVVARSVVLDAALAGALAARGVSQLRVDADEVTVAGLCALPGVALWIRCRDLVSRDGVLETSGPASPPPAEPKAPAGTAAAPHGQAGKDGMPGARAGDVRIACRRIQGSLRVVARGAAGGASQDGGDGAKPAVRNGRDGAFTRTPPQDEKDCGPWGGKVVKNGDGSGGFLGIGLISGATRRAIVAYGEPGLAGAAGGDGGAPGRPGRGGDGGAIELWCLEPHQELPHLVSEGGTPGACGKGGKGGPGGDGGEGGVTRLYYKHGKWEYDVPMTRSMQETKWARDDWKVPVRAAKSSQVGPAGKGNDTVAAADPGNPGPCECARVGVEQLAGRFEPAFVAQVVVWAQQSMEQGVRERGEQIARWGLELLDNAPGGSEPAAAPVRESLRTLVREAAQVSP